MKITQIKPTTADAYNLIHEGLIAFAEASRQGIKIDVPYYIKQKKILGAKVKISKKKFLESKTGKLWKKSYPNINLDSGPQLADILYNKLGLEVTKQTDKGNPSVDAEVLQGLKEELPEIEHLLNIKKYEKTRSTYIDNFIKEQVNGRIHPGFSLHIPRTFRSSSQNPNWQNLPKRDQEIMKICRTGILPTNDCLIEADFSGIEVGVSCCYHKDPKMIDYVKFPEKNNMHTDMAKQIFMLDKFVKEGNEKKLRDGAKNGFVFPQFYGDYYGNNAISLASWGQIPISGKISPKQGLKLITGKTLGQHLHDKGIHSYSDFENHIKEIEYDFWNNRFKKYGQWKKANVKKYFRDGYLQMLTGFTCSGLMSENEINNFPIQGSAFHCNLKSFIKINKELKLKGMKTRLIGQIHDSMIFDAMQKEIPELMDLLKYTVCEWLPEQWKWINIPFELEATVFDKGEHWASKNTKDIILRTS